MDSKQYKSPLHEMAETMSNDFWNDSCAIDELTYALEYGAVGATTNPVIVGNVLKQDKARYDERIKEMVVTMPEATEDDIAWKLNEEMAQAGAKMLMPIFEASNGQKGRISIQTNTKYYRNWKLLLEQTMHFSTLAPNIQVKMPVTKAGVKAVEEATYQGVSINATVSFTVPQALAIGAAVERGLKRREAEGKDTSQMHPVCTIMVGRIDDWLKEVVKRDGIEVNPEYLDWAGVAVMKNAYRIYNERGYRTQLLAAAYRNDYQWTEFMGSDLAMTIPHKWIKKFNESDVKVEPRMQIPVDPQIIETLAAKIPDFIKAYEAEGMTEEDFDSFGAVNTTLKQFLEGYDDLVRMIREYMVIIR
ncbi:transaldolase family protein [Anoxynatronum buryatiense]|uniref:Transaldolase n=1 Tax=Anoxynatronum buryatiense TaxID=489973 RepID=A0AA45WTE6_9CLOT|nr:transaldolase family protein [Anoxynatronum buryatiense]SMP41881.1 transaldolase [Anoxynatronum buryatiense]